MTRWSIELGARPALQLATAASSVMSSDTAVTLPRLRIAVAAASSLPASRAKIVTSPPSSSTASAVARPMPLLPPTMTTCRPASPSDSGARSPITISSSIQLSPCRSCLWGKHGLRFVDALEVVRAQGLGGDTRGRDELGRQDDRAVELGGNALQPAREIDRGTDHREVEARGRTDIAIEHVADMQRDAAAYELQACRLARRVAGSEPPLCARQGSQSMAADRADIAPLVERKHREHRIADEFEDLAAFGLDGAPHGAEIVVQQLDQFFARQDL